MRGLRSCVRGGMHVPDQAGGAEDMTALGHARGDGLRQAYWTGACLEVSGDEDLQQVRPVDVDVGVRSLGGIRMRRADDEAVVGVDVAGLVGGEIASGRRVGRSWRAAEGGRVGVRVTVQVVEGKGTREVEEMGDVSLSLARGGRGRERSDEVVVSYSSMIIAMFIVVVDGALSMRRGSHYEREVTQCVCLCVSVSSLSYSS